ncbi:heavy metal-associated isoprenylated plant protein 47-like [Syzygium oleosum]|uniref:heavy metal-associated isoprenylated plant protein 47-like n=1 Tax=Syzygium oleosum TaxID=219896 RepID=UPI0024B8F83C|nr:heavy metal-associated isoprenylated plant protein 47-like [Syzygium oleosum]
MVQQKMIIRMPMNSDKCRSEALRVVARAQGTIISVSIGGLNGDELVVTGEGVDPVRLVQSLRKKFRQATILRVEQISDDKGSSCWHYIGDFSPIHDHGYTWPRQHSPAYIEYPQYPVYHVAQHTLDPSDPPSICNIM